MRHFVTIIILLFLTGTALAQALEGTLYDKESNKPISGASVINQHTGEVTFSSAYGHYSIAAQPGDSIAFRHAAYSPELAVMSFAWTTRSLSLFMSPRVYTLKETTVSARTKYQQDSASRHELFGHELNKTILAKPRFTGLGCAGCIGWMVDKITGNSKKPKEFRNQFAADDQSRFVDSRYTPELVARLTGITEPDSLASFINRYPMAYDFARSASELELKTWIREQYKQFLQTTFTTKH